MSQEISRTLREHSKSFVTSLVEKVYDINIVENGNLNATRERLAASPETNLLIYANHLAWSDLVIFELNKRMLDPENERKRLLVCSLWYLKFGNSPIYAAGIRLIGAITKTELVPVVQQYMVSDPRYGFSEGEDLASFLAMRRTINKIRKQGIPITLIEYPEGHRAKKDNSKGDEMEFQEEEMKKSALDKVAKVLAPVILQPIVIIYPEGRIDRGLNIVLGRRTKIMLVPGKPVFQENRNDDNVNLDIITQNLTDVLLPKMRPQARR